jgi:hypothetical protein
MADEKRAGADRLGHYRLGRRFKRLGEDMGRLYKARNVLTGTPALVLVPADEATWAPMEDWRVETLGNKEPPYIALDILAGPASSRLTELHQLLEMNTAMLSRAKDDAGVRQHLTSPPERPQAHRPLRSRGLLAAAGVLALGCAVLLGACAGVAGDRLWMSASAMGGPTTSGLRAPDAADVYSIEVPPGMAYPLPDKPFIDQARPPCPIKRGAVEIKGGCWIELGRKPPCLEEFQAEYEGKCYLPVAAYQRPPQAVQP